MINRFKIILTFAERNLIDMKKNILIICADQMRADALSHLGCEASSTPNLDEMAYEGVSFSNAYCQNPVCTPSRCSFLSGLYPHTLGHRTMTHMIHEHESIILNEVKDNDYYVWMNARNDFLPAQNPDFEKRYADEVVENLQSGKPVREFNRGEKGSKHYYSHMGGVNHNEEFKDMDRLDCDELLNFIDNMPQDKSSLMFWGLHNPHPPYIMFEKYLNRIDDSKIHIEDRFEDLNTIPKMFSQILKMQNMQEFSIEDLKYIKKIYLSMCAYVDDLVGEIVAKLKENNQYDNTAIFFISDHGDFTGDYGIVEKAQNLFYDCLTNVPLIYKPISGTQFVSGVNDNLVELIDMYATILDITGIKETHSHFGKSLNSAINGEQNFRKAVFCEGGRLNEEEHCIELQFGKITEQSEYYPRQLAQSMSDGTHTKATMCRTHNFKYVKRLYEDDQFFDLKADKWERNNLIHDTNYAKEIARHKEIMLEWYQATCDIVPLKGDSRFSPSKLKLILKAMGMEEVFNTMIQPQLDNGVSIESIMGKFVGMNKEN